MTPSARIQAAIDILDLWHTGGEGLDRILAAWGRANRYAGSSDRRAIGDLVHGAVRRLRSAAWTAGADAPAGGREVLLGSLILDGHDTEALECMFNGEGHAPPPLSAVERAGLGRSLDAAPRPVRLDLPDWLALRLEHLPDAALAALRTRAPMFLRVNNLRADRESAIAALREDGIEAEPGPRAPTCLRVLSGAPGVTRSRAFREGLIEVQDAGSQAAADHARAQPGETVLDYCAGAGGKALALAAAMRGQGSVFAHDVSPKRLAQIDARAARAGARLSILPPDALDSIRGQCDLVFVDAPCSGSGAWRRNPDAKWQLTPARLESYLCLQREILSEAAEMLRPGGRLVYATCSILPDENEPQIEAFLAAASRFQRGRPPLNLLPSPDGDGFFACELPFESL